MELIRGLHNLRPRHQGCVATIGAFDGVHRGHQAVLRAVKERADVLGLPSAVIVFEPLPREYFAPREAPARLMNFREKFIAMAGIGLDRTLRIRFNRRLQSMSASEFIEAIFVRGLAVSHVVLGDDFRFGRGRQGDLELLQREGERFGFTTSGTDTFTCAGERVSSTRIREALQNGEFDTAERLLGRAYSMCGRVVYGRQLGREIGTPTANLALNRLRSPLSGVFVVEVQGAGLQGAPGVANVGTRPTVSGATEANLEVHLLDRDITLYGRRIEVVFRHRIREERKFASVDALKAQIARDVEAARHWFSAQESMQAP